MALLGAATLVPISASAHAQAVIERELRSDRDMRDIFDRIVLDPGNAALNFRYAQLASERGEYRKALAAYERVIARDPQNAQAREAIAQILRDSRPSYTTFNVSLGAQYESNPRHALKTNRRTDDAGFSARASITDERPLGRLYWSTEADANILYYASFHDIDTGVVGARTGPLIDLEQGFRLKPFVGFYYSWLTRRTYSSEPTAGIMLESERTAPLRSITARWAYQFVGRSFSERDGTYVEVAANLEWRGLVFERSLLSVSPYWRYSGVFGSGAVFETPFNQPFPARQHQFGTRADYYVPAMDKLIVNVNFAFDYRHYFERIPQEEKNRRDVVYAPGGQLIFGSFLDNQLDVIASYLFEYRHSNDGSQRYMNHVAGLRLLWRM